MRILILCIVLIFCITKNHANEKKGIMNLSNSNKIYQFKLNTIDGKEYDLKNLKEKVILIVNVASKCGFTNQYKGLQQIYQKYKENGFIVIGIPSNDFGRQEPGSETEIKTFCSMNYNTTFPLMEKSTIVGKNSIPLYKFLTNKDIHPKTGGKISWNFNKFLIDKNGFVVKRFSSFTKPESKKIINEINKYINMN